MVDLSCKIRRDFKRKLKKLRKQGIIPAVLYGPTIEKPQALEVDAKTFKKVYSEKGESSFIELEVDNKRIPVLIHQIQKNPLTDEIIHIDFYQPRMDQEITVMVPLVFEGISRAVKEHEGTLVKNISEVEVKALPQYLPKEIKVDISKLKTFEDYIFIRDLKINEKVKILKDPDEIVALVTPPENVEEELAKPLEEKIEDIEKVESRKKKESEIEK
jgi:large subunit ribosomal protein L25